MRAFALCFAIALASCKPEIVAGAYVCGPERYCPEDFVCNEMTVSCDNAATAQSFECAPGAADAEPDDNSEDGKEIGNLSCGTQIEISQADNLATWGCLANGDDVDHFRVAIPSCSGGDPHVSIGLQYHVAFAPLSVELINGAGEVVASGEICTDSSNSGVERLCLESPSPAAGDYVIRIRSTGEADCDGECAFNRYLLRTAYLLN
jgi:hypothetical protein